MTVLKKEVIANVQQKNDNENSGSVEIILNKRFS
jgi:hypothetical protein